jgi:transposase-like protein
VTAALSSLPASERTIKRRRRFSLEEKESIPKAAGEPGATVSEVSRQYGVGRSLIHNWRRQKTVAVLGATVRFTPVAVEAERRPAVERLAQRIGGKRMPLLRLE